MGVKTNLTISKFWFKHRNGNLLAQSEREYQNLHNHKMSCMRNAKKYKCYGHKSFYNLYTGLMAVVIKQLLPLEMCPIQ